MNEWAQVLREVGDIEVCLYMDLWSFLFELQLDIDA